jgi:hypothetical protein
METTTPTKLTFFEIPISEDHLAIAEALPDADVEEVVMAIYAFNGRARKLNQEIAGPQEALLAHQEIAFNEKKEALYKTMMDVSRNKEVDIETRLAAKQEWIRSVRVAEAEFDKSVQGFCADHETRGRFVLGARGVFGRLLGPSSGQTRGGRRGGRGGRGGRKGRN